MRYLILTLSLVSLSWPSTAFAQAPTGPWYAGVAAGGTQIRFSPYYTYPLGGEPDLFDNRTSGVQVDILGGRRQTLNERLSVAIQGLVSLNGAAWTLALPEEPADFRYSIPWTFAASVVSGVGVGEHATLFAEVGAGAGRVKMRKVGPATTSYDISEVRPAVTLGAGASFAISERISLAGAYRHARFSGLEFDTHDPSGAAVEHVEDAPRTHGVSAGITLSF